MTQVVGPAYVVCGPAEPGRRLCTALAATVAESPGGLKPTGLALDWQQAMDILDGTPSDRPEPGLDHLLRARFSKVHYVWLRWRDPLAAAIAVRRTAAPQAVFDRDAIAAHLAALQEADAQWRALFVRERLQALVVMQEASVHEPDRTMHGILRYIGLADPAVVVTPTPEAAQDPCAADWARHYNAAAAPVPPVFTSGRLRRRRAARPAPHPALPLTAFDVGSGLRMVIGPAPAARRWMDDSPGRFAYRCLPLVIANQAGWLVRNPQRMSVVWDGSSGLDGVRVTFDSPPASPYAISHFGSGIVTFSLGLLFRTPPGYNLHVRGPANWPKDGIYALDGIVETDWTCATFTMNWKLTRPGLSVTFEADEPVAMIAPVQRGELERFRPELCPIDEDPDTRDGYSAWAALRSAFNTALDARRPDAVQAGWQRHYMHGVAVSGEQDAPEHQTGLTLAAFVQRGTNEPR